MKKIAWVLMLIGVLGCTPPIPDGPATPIGDFKLGYNIVLGNDMVKGPLSRESDPETIVAAVKTAMDARLGRYDGDRYYHVVTKIDAYVLGRAGIPLVFNPQTALVVSMSVWDDAHQKRINKDPILLTILEGTNKSNLLGSGLGQTKEQQIVSIAESAAYQIEEWLRRQNVEQGWFDPTKTLPLYDIVSATPEAEKQE